MSPDLLDRLFIPRFRRAPKAIRPGSIISPTSKPTV